MAAQPPGDLMAAIHHHHRRRRRSSIDVLPLFLLIILAGRCADSQSPASASHNSTGNTKPNNSNNGPYFSTHFNPYTVIIIVVLISAFFLLGFFSIYIRRCSSDRPDAFGAPLAAAIAARIRLQRGLDPDVLESFPTLVYSEVKEHKIGKGELECAICLNEFEDDEIIRLLPNCDHVFHQECIDAWLDTHVTCPVCRTNYSDYVSSDLFGTVAEGSDFDLPAPAPVPELPVAPARDHVVDLADDVEERKEEMRELARIASKRRGVAGRRSRSFFLRSHSTGHCMMPKGEVAIDRYTLRLPENVRKEIIAAGKLKRAKTFEVGCEDGGTRRISRGGGEGSSRRNRAIRLGRSDRWPSFFVRSLSVKMPAWGGWRKGEDGSLSRKVSGVKPPADWVAGGAPVAGGGAAVAGGYKNNADEFSDESSTAALNRV